MPPTVTVATMTIFTTIELFIWLKDIAPKLVSTRLFVLDFTKELPYKISSISPPL